MSEYLKWFYKWIINWSGVPRKEDEVPSVVEPELLLTENIDSEAN